MDLFFVYRHGLHFRGHIFVIQRDIKIRSEVLLVDIDRFGQQHIDFAAIGPCSDLYSLMQNSMINMQIAIMVRDK